jgi:Tfp pilus assembly ATPase PilU
MQTKNQSLAELYMKRQISYEEALNRSSVPEELLAMMDRAGAGQAPRRAVGGIK